MATAPKRNIVQGASVVIASCLFIACTPAATDPELELMCLRYVKLDGRFAFDPVDARVTDVMTRAEDARRRLEDGHAAAQRALEREQDENLQSLRAALNRPAEARRYAAKLRATYDERRRTLQTNHRNEIERIARERDEAVAALREGTPREIAQAAALKNECLEAARRKRPSQAGALCRARASSLDTYLTGCP